MSADAPDLSTPAGRRRALVASLRAAGADPIDLMDAASPVPSVPEWRAWIYDGDSGGVGVTDGRIIYDRAW